MTKMNELKRRALLGNQQAQEECTRKKIVLPCPCCGKNVHWDFESEMVYHNYRGCILSGKFIPLPQWNFRPVAPVGRCGECVKLRKGGLGYGWCGDKTKRFDSFCSDFKPKNE